MGKAYSHDLRTRVRQHIGDGHSRRDAGRRFGVSASTAIRLEVLYRETGDLAPRQQGRPKGQGKLAPYLGFLTEIVDSVPDITLLELTEALASEHGITVHQSSISRALQAAEYTYKKIADGVRVRARGCAQGPARMDRPAPAADARGTAPADLHR